MTKFKCSETESSISQKLVKSVLIPKIDFTIFSMWVKSSVYLHRFCIKQFDEIFLLFLLASFTHLLTRLLHFRRKPLDEPHDACRVHGSLTLNKVSGNFHIAAGKSVPLMRGHAHLTTLFDDNEANFSHRIGHYSHFI